MSRKAGVARRVRPFLKGERYMPRPTYARQARPQRLRAWRQPEAAGHSWASAAPATVAPTPTAIALPKPKLLTGGC